MTIKTLSQAFGVGYMSPFLLLISIKGHLLAILSFSLLNSCLFNHLVIAAPPNWCAC